ncbi:unnamed protein product [Blepharisma stoltei]|uniref:Uncharacterized protein n=1 Tax=Blepharisma stoltei TaxID=1481888 RepID=A0AAU9IKL0_9CILI|nr:unnamed protein product [Blepharisma stoltei]
MGCGGSTKNKIVLEIETCGIEEVDSMFIGAAEPLKALDKAYHKLKKQIKKFKKATGCYILKDATFTDALESMLFCFSASIDGDFSKIDLQVTTGKPYIKISKDGLKPEHSHVADAWDLMLGVLEESIIKAPQLFGQLRDFWLNILQLQSQADKALKGVNFVNRSKGMKCCRANTMILAQGSKAFADFQNTISQVNQDAGSFANKCWREQQELIEKVGKDANKDNIYEPKEIIKKFWPDHKRVDLSLDKPPKQKK